MAQILQNEALERSPELGMCLFTVLLYCNSKDILKK